MDQRTAPTDEDRIDALEARAAAVVSRMDQLDAESRRLLTTLRFVAGHLATALERVNV